MIELTEQQWAALGNSHADAPARIVNPRTKEQFVLLPADQYERLIEPYDDSEWTREELHALAWEAGKSAEWEEMNEYDDMLEKP
jgi:hypothetical protein